MMSGDGRISPSVWHFLLQLTFIALFDDDICLVGNVKNGYPFITESKEIILIQI